MGSNFLNAHQEPNINLQNSDLIKPVIILKQIRKALLKHKIIAPLNLEPTQQTVNHVTVGNLQATSLKKLLYWCEFPTNTTYKERVLPGGYLGPSFFCRSSTAATYHYILLQ